MDKKNKGLMAVVALAIVVVTVAATYAFITFVIEGKKTNTITGGNLVVTLDDSTHTEDITLSNAFPVSDAVGKQSEDFYQFTLTNESEKDVGYTIYLDEQPVDDGVTRLSDSMVKVYLTENNDTVVAKDVSTVEGLGESVTRVVNDETVTSRPLAMGLLSAASGDVATSKTFKLRLWISSEATDSDVWDKTDNGDGTYTTVARQYATKISVDATQVAEYAVSVTNETQLLNQVVFLNGTATFTLDLTLGTGTPSVTCSNGTPTLDTTNSTLTVAGVTAHTTCSITYTEETTTE